MKKIITVIVLMLMTISLTACSNNDEFVAVENFGWGGV